jgi:hypothetical protein
MPAAIGVSSRTDGASRVTPREERIDDVARSLLAHLLFLSSRRISERAFYSKE